MNFKAAAVIIQECRQLRAERDRYRAECRAERVLCGLLAVACLIVIGTKYPLVILALFCVLAAAVMVGGLCWSAKRGDEAMGIDDNFRQ